jgi:hypothetical protein
MPNALAFVGGGLLQGFGRGLVLSGKEKRDAALKRIEDDRAQKRALELEDVRQEGRRGLLDASNTAARERLGLNIASRENVARQATTSREQVASEAATSRQSIASEAATSRERIGAAANVSREKAARIRAGKASDSSAAEKRAFDSLVEIHTVTDENGLEATDWNAVATGLDEKGFGKLAKAARSRGKGIADLDIRQRAEQFADDLVEEQAGTFSTDATDFKDDGGSRTRFRARMVREFIAKNGGKAAAAPATRPATTGDDPYVGAVPPRDHPDAKRAPDGFWYLPPLQSGGKFRRVQKTEANRMSGSRSPRDR